MSVIVSVLGLVGGFFMFTRDWWRPQTLTGTSVGLEDLLFGFGFGGIAFAYPVLWNKQIAIKENTSYNQKLLVAALGFGPHIVFYFVFGLHSFYSSSLGMILPALAIYYYRRDLIKPSLLMASLAAVWAFLAFNVLNAIDRGFVYRWYLLKQLSGVVLYNAVPEDLFWFFAGGMLFTIIYPFWTGKQFVDMSENKQQFNINRIFS